APVQASAPTVRLVSVEKERQEQATLASGVLLVLLLGIGFLSFFPALVARIRLFWPEPLLFAVGLALAVLGWNWWIIWFGTVAVGIRLFLLGRWLWRHWHQARSVPPAEGAGVAS